MERKPTTHGLAVVIAFAALICAVATVRAQDKKPNILILWGDDIGIHNISAYNLDVMDCHSPALVESPDQRLSQHQVTTGAIRCNPVWNFKVLQWLRSDVGCRYLKYDCTSEGFTNETALNDPFVNTGINLQT
jgi:hypothetical protein